MTKLPLRFSITVAVLQCIGCAADSESDAFSGIGSAPRVESSASQDEPSTRNRIEPLSAPAAPPMRADYRERGELTSGPYLATESAFIEQNGISGDKSDDMLGDLAQFSKALERMRHDEGTSAEAQDLARHHRIVLERAVGEQGVIEELTCGLSLCLGSVTSLSESDHDTWNARLARDPAARRYGAIQRIEPVGDQFQNRFLFSADPSVAAIFMDR